METVQDLETKVEDATGLADSFHEKLASERNLRSTAEASLATAHTKITELEAEIVSLRDQHCTALKRLEAEASDAATAAAAVLVSARQVSHDALLAAGESATEALEAERNAGTERLNSAKRDAEGVVEGLRGEMAAAVQAATIQLAESVEKWCQEKARLEEEMVEAVESARLEEERLEAKNSALEEAHAKREKEMQESIESEKTEAAREAEEADEKLTAAKSAFGEDLADVRKELEGELEEAKMAAGRDLAAAQERTADKEKGRLEEIRMKVRPNLLYYCWC